MQSAFPQVTAQRVLYTAPDQPKTIATPSSPEAAEA
jgi:hypothetical protein